MDIASGQLLIGAPVVEQADDLDLVPEGFAEFDSHLELPQTTVGVVHDNLLGTGLEGMKEVDLGIGMGLSQL